MYASISVENDRPYLPRAHAVERANWGLGQIVVQFSYGMDVYLTGDEARTLMTQLQSAVDNIPWGEDHAVDQAG